MLTRRELLQSVPPGLAVVATVAIPAIAEAVENPDAELFRLGAEFDRLRAEYLPLEDEAQRLMQVWLAECDRRGVSLTKEEADGFPIAQEVGSADADARVDPVERAYHEMVETILLRTPAATLAGLALKTKVIRLAVLFDDKEPTEEEYKCLDMDWDKEVPLRFLFEVERVAAKAAVTV